ncbi:nucleolin-like isoform X2 [Portunus trituberculatus]|uniref:nucleolin-like isoform X2 n=1 Tax=Portunus trituberculatus TaxID=210409 RepID=UPI001E1D0D51|nr:nucleolin-like isoform X2 [Portunus trituberculatus]
MRIAVATLLLLVAIGTTDALWLFGNGEAKDTKANTHQEDAKHVVKREADEDEDDDEDDEEEEEEDEDEHNIVKRDTGDADEEDEDDDDEEEEDDEDEE